MTTTTKERVRRINLLESTARTHDPDSDSYRRLMGEARELRVALQRDRAIAKGRPVSPGSSRTHRIDTWQCQHCGRVHYAYDTYEACVHECLRQKRKREYEARERARQKRPRPSRMASAEARARQQGPQPEDYGMWSFECSCCGKRFSSYSFYDKCSDCIRTRARRRPKCSYCGMRGHTRAQCPENPEASKGRARGGSRQGERTEQTFTETGNPCGTKTKSKWGPKVCECGSKVSGRLNKQTGIRKVYCRSSGEMIFESDALFFD